MSIRALQTTINQVKCRWKGQFTVHFLVNIKGFAFYSSLDISFITWVSFLRYFTLVGFMKKSTRHLMCSSSRTSMIAIEVSFVKVTKLLRHNFLMSLGNNQKEKRQNSSQEHVPRPFHFLHSRTSAVPMKKWWQT